MLNNRTSNSSMPKVYYSTLPNMFAWKTENKFKGLSSNIDSDALRKVIVG